MANRAAVILAAGQGTRMRSPTPKVLHRVGGRAMMDHAIDAALAAGCSKVVVVVGAHSPAVRKAAEARLGAENVVTQDPPNGTGHAVQAAQAVLRDFDGDVVVTYADVPLLDAAGLEPVFKEREAGADVVVLGFEAADPRAYGRLIMDHYGLLRIVETSDADDAALQVRRCNSGVMAADAALLFDLLSEVKNENSKGEYYLTDIVGIARARELTVKAVFTDEGRVHGVNSQAELAAAERLFQNARRAEALTAGVCMPAPETVFFAFDTRVEGGAVIEPYVVFGPGVTVKAEAHIKAFSHLEGALVGEAAFIGPYARLRPGADIGKGAHIGNFVEVKKVRFGDGAKANHLSYLGDGSVGAGANIGAGVIFCNYDGFDKAETHIGKGAFIGSDTALVAPVRVGDGAYIGSGSVIVSDVSDNALALARGRQVEKPGWAETFRNAKLAARKAK